MRRGWPHSVVNRNDRSIVGLVMAAHAMVHTYELSIPIFMGVWLAEFDVSTGLLGLVVSIGYALFGLGALPGGVLADAVGSRRLIAVCFLSMGGSFVVLSVLPGRGLPPMPVIAIALVLWGVAASVYHPSGLSLISTGVTERGSAFAYHGMAGNFGIAFGPLATTLLLLAFDWRIVAAMLAVPALGGAALSVWLDVDETAAVDDSAVRADGDSTTRTDGDGRASAVSSLPEFLSGTKALFTGAFVLVFLIVVCSGLYYRGFLTFLPVILDGFPGFEPIEVAGQELSPSRYAYVGLLAVGMAGQFVGGKLTDRIRPSRGIAASFGLLAVLAVAFVPMSSAGLAAFVVVAVALGFALFLVQPMYQALVARITPAGTRGLSYGYTYLGVFGVGAIGGTLAGVVLQYATPLALFLVLAGIAGTAALTGAVLAVRYD